MKDTVTHLDSYDSFIDKLKEAMDSLSEDVVIPIIYSDIKHFKYFNDTYGYKKGDELIAEFARCVSQDPDSFITGTRVVSDNIVAAGYVSSKVSVEMLFEYVKQVNEELENHLCEMFDCKRLKVASGVFYITSDNKDMDPETAIANANVARKLAKESRDESVVLFDDKMADRINNDLEILNSIKDAIKNRELVPYYQPKIDSDTGKINGAEALVRWKKPDGKFVYPDQFIPAIEKSGQIVDVDYFMYEEVIRFIGEKLSAGESVVPISLNVSRQHFKNFDIIDKIMSLMDKYHVPADYLEFEITETTCMENPERAMTFIDRLHDMGIKVSMDDFGSGYSSLNFLSEVSFDVIKLDRAFLRTVDLKKKEKIILANIINMARELGMQSLCEGVETETQSSFLKDIGCDIQQGFFYSRPIPRMEFEAMLA
ncbi:MAG: GGDEF domain-containing phosphodiesterase [Lachnospiraceae bacterium]|nr:GGDEF domain-containing phosphodiesterase [Lachnospiraceae bacterium]